MRNFVVGASVVSIKYRDGIIMATDTQASYGYLAKYNDVAKLFKASNSTLISVSGDLADMQNFVQDMNSFVELELITVPPLGMYEYTWNKIYDARSDLKPLNLFVSVGGIQTDCEDPLAVDERNRLLGAVTNLGGCYFSDVISSGLGSYLVLPFLRDRVEGKVDDLSREDGISIVEEAMRLLCYRNLRSSNKIVVGYVDSNGVNIGDAYSIDTSWDVGKLVDEIVID